MYRKILQQNPSLKKASVLVADDSEISRNICQKFLREAGFDNIQLAENGEEAYKLIEKNPPGIVIADIFMPGFSGFELVQKLRENENTKNIAILVHTAANTSKDINEAFIKGANDVVLKPVQKEEFLTRCTMHLENSLYRKRINEELEQARSLQNTIIPNQKIISSIKENLGIDIGSKFQPTSELGGDFWGIKQLSENELALYCVDLTGHGIASALNAFRVHSLIEENIKNYKKTDEFLNKINSILADIMPTGQYATMFYGIINTSKNILEYSNAASLPPLLLSDNKSDFLRSPELPLGVSKDTIYKPFTSDFPKNSTLILFSDALIETPNPEGDMFNESMISKTSLKSTNKTAQEIADNIFQKFTSFTERTILDDDLTICVFKR